jgi:hypothetical protein
MKFSATLFASALASVLQGCNADVTSRGLVNLATKWNIDDPTFDYSELSFDLDYTVTNYITAAKVRYTVWDANCKKPNDENSAIDLISAGAVFTGTLDTSLLPTADLIGDGSEALNVKLTLVINPDTIASAPAIYSEATSANGELVATVNFCVRFMLETAGSSNIEANFLQTLITLNIDLSDGFEIGTVAVAPQDQVLETANQVYEVDAFQCNPSNNAALSLDAAALARNQGAVIRVCVQPKQEARNSGVYMRTIDSFSYTRAADPPTTSITQVAVVGGAGAANGLTNLDCEAGYEICAFDSILFAAFYASTGIVTGGGVASMQFGGSSRRLRNKGRSAAQQADDEIAGAAEFELDFKIDRGASIPSGVGAIGGFLAASFMAFAGAIAML